MNAEVAGKVVDWLKGLGHTKDVQPVKVTLGDGKSAKTYFGAKYITVLHYTADMRAVTDGKHKAGEAYENEHFYLVGEHPWTMKNRRHFCFPMAGYDWYISGYFDGRAITEHQPFGANFMLGKWDVPDGTKIDTYERFKYPRVAITVTPLA